MYDTASIVNWLRDKAVRAEDPGWQRMMQLAAERLEELDRSRRWFNASELLPPTTHEVYQDVDGPIEWDASEPVLVVTMSGDLVLARFVLEDGKKYWCDVNHGEECDVDLWRPDPRTQMAVNAVMDNVPGVDAAEVVFCKECMWRNSMGCPYVRLRASAREDHDYCSDGEKRIDE